MSRLFIHAINVHQGGGAVLFCDLILAIPIDVETVVHVDARLVLPQDLPNNIKVWRVEPTLFGRFASERILSRKVGPSDCVLCFGNLPPLFKLSGKVVVFLQNRYLVDLGVSMGKLPIKTRTRIWLERAWLRSRSLNAHHFFVQTPSMQKLTEMQLSTPVICAPFIPSRNVEQETVRLNQQYDFLYVASAEPHKNHSILLDAWVLLAQEGLFPSLALTLEPKAAPDLCERIAKEVTSRRLHIFNLGILPHAKLLEQYRKSGALIYPSSFESFGMPLLEARQFGLPVLAPELDYVRDLTDPEETFDPQSAMSIARAVKRLLNIKGSIKTPVTAEEFLKRVLCKDFL